MRNALKVLLVVALAIPTLASADIITSKHNLTSTGTGTTKTNFVGDACGFCHLVHNAQTTSALWGRLNPTVNAGFAAGNTLAGTVLPTTQNPATQRCMSCHDGTLAMNVVTNKNSIATTYGTFTASTNVSAGGLMMAGSRDYLGGAGLAGQHPVQIPYAGQLNGAPAGAVNGYNPATNAGCLGGAVNCVSGANNGANIKLFGTAGALTMECASCHEVHSDANPFFLRIPTAANRCIACHVK
jgi:predicted CXXCH cytochrome family protein